MLMNRFQLMILALATGAMLVALGSFLLTQSHEIKPIAYSAIAVGGASFVAAIMTFIRIRSDRLK